MGKAVDDLSKREYQIDVADHPNVMLWLKDLARKDPEGFLRLVGDNTVFFERLFGKPTWRNNGEKGWTHGWALYESNMHWLVLTGPQGTIFRLRLATTGDDYLKDPRVGTGVARYLTTLLQQLSEL